MAAGCGGVVVGGAQALWAMLLHSILARMASRGAAHRAQSALMHRLAASMGSGGITGAIKCSSSARHCSVADSSWRRLSLANTGSGKAKSADTTACTTANADSAARTTNKEQRSSLASAISPNIAQQSAAFWQQHSLARVPSTNTAAQFANSWRLHSAADTNLPMLQRILLTLGDIAPWRCQPILSLPQPSYGNIACRPHWPTLSPMWLPCCCREVLLEAPPQ